MKKLTVEDLRNLKFEDIVYKYENYHFRRLYFVSKMPKSENSLIFCAGEYLTTLYINKKGEFSGDWYQGDCDSKSIGKKLIEHLECEIESLKRSISSIYDIYLNQKS